MQETLDQTPKGGVSLTSWGDDVRREKFVSLHLLSVAPLLASCRIGNQVSKQGLPPCPVPGMG